MRSRKPAFWRLLLASSCLLPAPAGAQAATPTAATPDGNDGSGDVARALPRALPGALPGAAPNIALVQPVFNGDPTEQSIFVVVKDGDILLPSDFLKQRGVVNAGKSVRIKDQDFTPARTSPLLRVSLDEREGVVRIDCPAACFEKNALSASGAGPAELSDVSLGGFLNYDLFGEVGDGDDRYGGYAEAGVFSNAGTGLASAVCSNAYANGACIRLETSWTVDDPKTARRLRIGDATTAAASWGAPARFGGVRWGTDYSLQPDFITFPTPSFSGEAALPGSVEVFIDNARRFESGLPAGPFSISDLPVVTGAGSAQIVVTDLLGRETVIAADYYAAPQLLKRGLAQYSLEAGFLREDYGVRSNAYGEAFAAGGYARGLTDWFTAGFRSELGEDRQTAGLSAAFAGRHAGVFQAAAAFSRADGESGGLVDIRHEWRSSSFSIGNALSYATKDFRRFGQDRAAARLTARSFIGYSDADFGSLSINWIYRDERGADDFSAAGARYMKSFKRVSISFSALRTIEPESEFVAMFALSAPLGDHASASAGVDYDGERVGGDFRFRRSPPLAGGLGYHGRAAFDGVDRYEAGLQYRTPYGDVAADFSKVNDRKAGRFSARGGVAIVAGEAFAAPSITDSIAVVSVGREEGVRVYHDRQLVGRTGANGKVVIPRLRAFERNEISFAPDDVSLAADFTSAQTTVTPGFRTGHRVAFDVERPVNVVATIIRRDGAPVETGRHMTNMETGEAYPIGRNGRIYIPAALAATRLRYDADGSACEADVAAPRRAGEAAYFDVGAIVCDRPGAEEGR